jgi:ligand-binding sensor domain-containing protein/serine phosphatase RsbU (regulator of sigma subunit)
MQFKKRFSQKTLVPVMAILSLLVAGPACPAQKIPFSNFTIQNGLPQNVVNGMCQDSDGYIWFATQVGAARYDGYEFKYFTVSDGLPNNYINTILAASDGSIWFGTEGGVARYYGSQITVYTEESGLIYNHIDRLTEDLEGNIWVVTANGISVIAGDSIVSYSKGQGLTDNSVLDIFVDSRGTVHVATFPECGLTLFTSPYKYTTISSAHIITDIAETPEGDLWYATQDHGIVINLGENEQKLGYAQGLTDEDVLSLMVDHSGRIWCSTYVEGIFIYENGKFVPQKMEDENQPVIIRMFEDSHLRIWFLDAQNGVWLKENDRYKHLTMENNLVNDVVRSIIEDKYGNVWLGTISGASKYGRILFEVYDSDGLLPENDVTAVYFDTRGRVWFAPYGSLMYLYKDRMYKLDNIHNGFTEGAVTLAFAEDHRNNIYVGTDYGLLYFNGRSMVTCKYWGAESEEIQFYSLYYSDDDKLWCGTDQGLYVYRNGRRIIYHQDRTLLNLQVNAIEPVEDRVYCATEGGISVFNSEGDHLINYTRAEGLSSNVCNDIVHDTRNNIWVATDLGLTRISGYEHPEFTTFDAGDGLTSNAIYFLHFSDSTSLWLGTEKGLYKYDTENGDSRYYGIEEGFYPLETYLGAVTSGRDGDMWMGTVAGLCHYMPEYDKPDPVPPDLILYPPLINGQEYHPGQTKGDLKPEFPFNKNSVEFRYTGIHTTIPEKNRFTYYLKGYDEDWSPPVKDRSANYKKLPSGNYVFMVKAYNLDGVETEAEASFAFIIKPPFWKTAWFIIFEILAGLSLIYGTIKFRERQLIKEKRILESRVRERTREIEDQKVEIEAQRDEIFGKNKEITDSIQYAKHIQHAVLPGKTKLEGALPEHFILFRPRDIVSGDFYWVEHKNDRIVLCAADCTGHGVPGAFMSLLGLTFLNEIVNKDEILKASEILNNLRNSIINSMSHKDMQARDGMDVALIVIDKQLNILEFAGAYNPLVIIRGQEIIEYKGDKMPVGKHEGEERAFTNHKVILQEGDLVYLFSDGFADQFGGEDGGKYKAIPFKRLLQKISAEPMDRQEELLNNELNRWMGDLDQVDDILVVGIRYTTDS